MPSMILTCPSCRARYEVEAAELLPSGRKVQCSHCAHVWREPPLTETLGALFQTSEELGDTDIRPDVHDFDDDDIDEPEEDFEPPPQFDEPADILPVEADPIYRETAEFPDEAETNIPFEPLDIRARAEPLSGPPTKAFALSTPSVEAPPALIAPFAPVAPVAPRRRRRAGGAFLILAIALVAFLNIAWFGREEIISVYPPLATIYDYVIVDTRPGAGLGIVVNPPSTATENDVEYLEVSGRITNDGGGTRDIPELIGVLTDSEAVTVLQWIFSADEEQIGPGEVALFSSRVADRPETAACLNVYFVAPETNAGCN